MDPSLLTYCGPIHVDQGDSPAEALQTDILNSDILVNCLRRYHDLIDVYKALNND